MKSSEQFPFDRSRRISKKEVDAARKAIEKATGEKRKDRGRPLKDSSEKYQAISIRLHPKVLTWAKREAKKRGVGYQTVINEFLLKRVA
jgi:uncharacterized protein (DUF4415 family)